MIGGDGINDESNKTAPAPKLTVIPCLLSVCTLVGYDGADSTEQQHDVT